MCRFVFALLLAVSLPMLMGCIGFSHSSTTSAYTQLTSSTRNAPQPAYISALPMVKTPITKAKF